MSNAKQIGNLNVKKITNNFLITEEGNLISLYDTKRFVQLPITNVENAIIESTSIMVLQKDGQINFVDNPEFTSTINMGLTVSNFVANNIPNINQVHLTWKEPEVMDWRYTVIVRKLNSYPTSITDGDIILRNDVRNKYENEVYVDEVVFEQPTHRYYYRAFIVLQTFEIDDSNLATNKSEVIAPELILIDGYEFSVIVPESAFQEVNVELVPDTYTTTDTIIDGYSFTVTKTSDSIIEDIEITLG